MMRTRNIRYIPFTYEMATPSQGRCSTGESHQGWIRPTVTTIYDI